MKTGLGGRLRIKDRRDFKPKALGMGAPFPDSFKSAVPTIYMQGKYGTCGAHAGAQVANVLFNIVSSPKYLWKRIKQIDGYGLDEGTDMRSIFKAMKQFGICELGQLNNELGKSIEEYSDPKEITPEMDKNASYYKIDNYGFIDLPTWSQIKQAIYQYGAVILLVDCGDGWWLPQWGPVNNPLHVGNFVGHHFITATEYGMSLIDGPNSWSISWGDRGMFNFNSDFMPHVIELGFATKGVKYTFNNNMCYGMRNSDVVALQTKLLQLGYDIPSITSGATSKGYYGSETRKAVYKFQLDNVAMTPAEKMMAGYYCGPKTREALNK